MEYYQICTQMTNYQTIERWDNYRQTAGSCAKHNDGLITCDDGGSPIFAMRTFSQMRSQLTNMTLIIEFSSRQAQTRTATDMKSVNLKYITLGCLDDGTNESSTKNLMFQVLFFFILFIELGHSKLFTFLLYFFKKITKQIESIFAKNSARNHEKK